MKFKFSRKFFRKILNFQISWKPVQWEPSCSMRKDRRRDITKLIVAFRYFANAPKKGGGGILEKEFVASNFFFFFLFSFYGACPVFGPWPPQS
jgi:hypothetical protein